MRRSGFGHVFPAADRDDAPMDALDAHALRTAWLAERVARTLGLDEATIEIVREAAFTHDIGKHFVSRSLLAKPGRLNSRERRQVEMHAVLGGRFLMSREAQRGGQPSLKAQVALLHHEWWNGMGYPFGLSGARIPLAARIVSVADVFDALAHEREYKPAWPLPDVLRYLQTQRGRQFDPVCAEAMHAVGQALPHGWSALASRDGAAVEPAPAQYPPGMNLGAVFA